MVMYLGQVAEPARASAVRPPAHPYTKALLSAMPSMDPDHRTQNRRRWPATHPTRSTRPVAAASATRCPHGIAGLRSQPRP
jgi:peptide/nickel transport system ATP-binding protein